MSCRDRAHEESLQPAARAWQAMQTSAIESRLCRLSLMLSAMNKIPCAHSCCSSITLPVATPLRKYPCKTLSEPDQDDSASLQKLTCVSVALQLPPWQLSYPPYLPWVADHQRGSTALQHPEQQAWSMGRHAHLPLQETYSIWRIYALLFGDSMA